MTTHPIEPKPSRLAPDVALALATVTDNLSRVRDYMLDRADYDFAYSEYPSGSYHGNAEARFAEEVGYEIDMLNRLNYSDKLDPKHECRCVADDLEACATYFKDAEDVALKRLLTADPEEKWMVESYRKVRDARKYLTAALAQLQRVVEGSK